MFKILSRLLFAFVVSASTPLALAADMATQKVAVTTIQKVDLATQKNAHSQINSISNEASVKPVKKISDAESTSTKAQLGLLLTALFCFVALSNRRGV